MNNKINYESTKEQTLGTCVTWQVVVSWQIEHPDHEVQCVILLIKT